MFYEITDEERSKDLANEWGIEIYSQEFFDKIREKLFIIYRYPTQPPIWSDGSDFEFYNEINESISFYERTLKLVDNN